MVDPNQDVQLLAAVRRYVMRGRPYLKFQGWNLRNAPQDTARDFGQRFGNISARADDLDIMLLLQGDWRAKLTASWMAAMSSRLRFGDLIGSVLLSEDGEQAKKGYAFALTSFSRNRDLACLEEFLHRILVDGRRNSAHEWALAGWRYLHPHGKQGEPSWVTEMSTPPEVELMDFLQGWLRRFGVDALKEDPGFDPLSAFRKWTPGSGTGRWAVVEEEAQRAALDQWLLAHPESPDALRTADPLAVATSTDGGTILYGLAPGSHTGRWAVVERGVHSGRFRSSRERGTSLVSVSRACPVR